MAAVPTPMPPAAVAPVRLLYDAAGELGGVTHRQARGWRGRNRGRRKADAACHQQRSKQCPHMSSFNPIWSRENGQIPAWLPARSPKFSDTCETFRTSLAICPQRAMIRRGT
jgi:hypothetical protein